MVTARRTIAAFLSLCLLSSCATILHPERRGNAGGRIDVGPLILDILWFIPGIVPGVIALAVDFSTGAIYVGGRRSGRMEVGREGYVAIHKPDLDRAAHVELRVLDMERRVLATESATWQPDQPGDAPVRVSLAEVAARLPAGDEPVLLQLELVVDGERVARSPLQMR